MIFICSYLRSCSLYSFLGTLFFSLLGISGAGQALLDFNTMGSASVEAPEEIQRLDESAVAARMRHIPPGRSCSYIDDEQTGLLDHMFLDVASLSSDLEGLPGRFHSLPLPPSPFPVCFSLDTHWLDEDAENLGHGMPCGC